jgi:hypothetical protein
MDGDGSIASSSDGRSATREREAFAVVRLSGASQMGLLLMSAMPVRTTVRADVVAGMRGEITAVAYRAK